MFLSTYRDVSVVKYVSAKRLDVFIATPLSFTMKLHFVFEVLLGVKFVGFVEED